MGVLPGRKPGASVAAVFSRSSAGLQAPYFLDGKPPLAQSFRGIGARYRGRTLDGARGTREARRRRRLHDAVVLDESSAMAVVRMGRRFGHRQDGGEAYLAALHDPAPLFARFGAENRREPIMH